MALICLVVMSCYIDVSFIICSYLLYFYFSQARGHKVYNKVTCQENGLAYRWYVIQHNICFTFSCVIICKMYMCDLVHPSAVNKTYNTIQLLPMQMFEYHLKSVKSLLVINNQTLRLTSNFTTDWYYLNLSFRTK